MPGSALLDPRTIFSSMGLGKGDVMVELGCGQNGHLLFPAARHVGDSGYVYGVDLSDDVIAMLKNRIPHEGLMNVEPVWGDFERPRGTRLASEVADHVLCVNNLWCLKDYRTLLVEMKRLLKPGGSGYLIDWEHASKHPVAPPASYRADIDDVYQLVKNAGYEAEEIPVGNHHWGMRLIF